MYKVSCGQNCLVSILSSGSRRTVIRGLERCSARTFASQAMTWRPPPPPTCAFTIENILDNLDHIHYEAANEQACKRTIIVGHSAVRGMNHWCPPHIDLRPLTRFGNVLLYNRSGYGSTIDRPEAPNCYGFDHHYAYGYELLTLIDAWNARQGPQDITFLGHSDGTTCQFVAAAIDALNGGERRIDLIIAESPHVHCRDERSKQYLRKGFDMFRRNELLSDRFWRAMDSDFPHARNDTERRRMSKIIIDKWFEGWLSDESLSAFDVEEALDAIEARVLLIQPEYDPFFEERQAWDIYNRLANCELIIAPKKDHTPHAYIPDWFLQRCVRFHEAHLSTPIMSSSRNK